MLNMKDVYVAGERYEDIRRTAEKHNAAARMEAIERAKRQERQVVGPTDLHRAGVQRQ